MNSVLSMLRVIAGSPVVAADTRSAAQTLLFRLDPGAFGSIFER